MSIEISTESSRVYVTVIVIVYRLNNV